jgi:GTP-binding protein
MGRARYGSAADDIIVKVPVGTLVYDLDNDDLLSDLDTDKTPLVVARGGKGGLGNIHFKNSITQAPRKATPGEPGEFRRLRLELKLLADVGVVGFPNTGKSTLVSRLSRAKPKIADYPFTTLVPTLGVVPYGDNRSFVMADVPGLIKGASDGHGLGHRFLKHVERCRLLVHLSTWMPGDPPSAAPLLNRLDVLKQEMRQYNKKLSEKPTLIAISKIDLPDVDSLVEELSQELAKRDLSCVAFSAVSGQGLDKLVGAVSKMLDNTNEQSRSQVI